MISSNNSNDVNVIFAFLDVEHKFHQQASLFTKSNPRKKLILLANVMKSFLNTYSNYIKDVGQVIEFEIIKSKKERKNSPVKNPSSTHIIKYVESGINTELQKLGKKYNYSQDSLIRFKDLLLAEFSIPELYFEDKSRGEFREMFIEKAKDLSINSANEFLSQFKRKEIMKQGKYKEYDKFLEITKFVKDHEDRRICAELFCFGNEIAPIKFLTFDTEFKKILKKTGPNHNVSLV